MEKMKYSPIKAEKHEANHLIHKIPSGDSPYVRAKYSQVRQFTFLFSFFCFIISITISFSFFSFRNVGHFSHLVMSSDYECYMFFLGAVFVP